MSNHRRQRALPSRCVDPGRVACAAWPPCWSGHCRPRLAPPAPARPRLGALTRLALTLALAVAATDTDPMAPPPWEGL